MKSDIEIAQENMPLPIWTVAKNLNIDDNAVSCFGETKAKINLNYYDKIKSNKDGKLILVTAINPTKSGEGKTTMSIALAQGLATLGEKAILALREPSLGPVFGIKGGATGGGYSQVVPMEEINLHFTGDMHAITACNNLISAVLDNHIFQGNALNIDPDRVVWKRCMDMNDRALRDVEVNIGNDVKRKESFNITVASEVMAILCLSTSIFDFKDRISKCIVAYTKDGKPVTVADLHVEGSCAALMKDAINPNLVQTLEHVPALIHGGPFANIAHGCNSIVATKLGLKIADYIVTEAGFGADLGAEKFFDIKCQVGDLHPDGVVIVATTRALKLHGGAEDYKAKNLEALEKGLANLEKHASNVAKYKLPFVICINHFENDDQEEIDLITAWCQKKKYKVAFCDGHAKGGEGSTELAKAVIEISKEKSKFKPLYRKEEKVEKKIEKIAKEIYGAKKVVYSDKALEDLKLIHELGLDDSYVCIAKTQYSLSDNQDLIGVPKDFDLHVREVRVSAGAGFVIPITGSIMTMPGLSKKPAAEIIDINDQGEITGLY